MTGSHYGNNGDAWKSLWEQQGTIVMTGSHYGGNNDDWKSSQEQ